MADQPTFDKVLKQSEADAHLQRLGATPVKRKLPKWILYSMRSGGQALASTAADGKIRLRVYAGECPCDAM